MLEVTISRFPAYGYTTSGTGVQFQGNAIVATGCYYPSGPVSRNLVVNTLQNTTPYYMTNCVYGIQADLMSVNAFWNNISNNGTAQSWPYNNSVAGIAISNSHYCTINLQQNQITTFPFGIKLTENDPVQNENLENNLITVLGTPHVAAPYHYAPNNGVGISVKEDYHLPGNLPSTIQGNTISLGAGAAYGISVNGSSLTYLYQNSVSFQHNGSASSGIMAGIYLAGCEGGVDYENMVTGDPNTLFSNGNNHPTGFLYSNLNSGSFMLGSFPVSVGPTHKCNFSANTYTDFQFTGTNMHTTFMGNASNYYSGGVGSHFGLQLDQGNTLNQQAQMANMWYGNYDAANNGLAANNLNANNLGLLHGNRFTADPNSPYWPPSIFPANGWFSQGIADNDPCPIPLTTPPPLTGNIDAMDMAVIDNNLAIHPFGTEMLWQSAKTVYERLRYNTALLDSGADIQTFYTGADTANTGRFTRVKEGEMAAMIPDSATFAGLSAVKAAIDSLQNAVFLLDSAQATLIDTLVISADSGLCYYLSEYMANLVKEGSFANDSLADIYIANVDSQLNAGNPVTDTGMYNAWGNQILNISAAIAALQQTADSLISAFDSVRYQKVALAANDNAAIIPGNDIETYYQAANDIYLNTIAIDSNVFDSTQLAELYELAFLCPLKGGQAVFKARSMLALVTDTFYNDDSVCACIMHDDDKRLNISRPDSTYITDTNAITVKMYPNPARNYVVLALSQAINGPVLLKVADALGSIILNTNISLQAGIYTINTASFSSGVYYVTLYTGQNEIFNGKLVIFEK